MPSVFSVKKTDGMWVVPDKMNFPADAGTVSATLNGMADLEASAQKTQREDWMKLLDLAAPEEDHSRAVRIVLSDAQAKPMASLLVGKSDTTTDTEGRPAIYVRRSDEKVVWLARGYLTARRDIGDWLDKNVVPLTREQVQETDITPQSGPAYVVKRDSKTAPNFILADVPKGRAVNYESAPDGVATALVGFAFVDLKPVGDVDFKKTTNLVTKTFDGLVITTKIAGTDKDPEHWAMIMVTADKPEAQAAASAISGKVMGWAFKLPEYKASVFLTTRESLLRPLPGQTVTPTTTQLPR